jgi:putative addiction module component (TIGR02574 family)
MSPDVEKLLEAAMKLPPEARAALAGSLIESLDELVDEDAERLWSAEVAERVRDLDQGRVKPVPWSTARRKIVEG